MKKFILFFSLFVLFINISNACKIQDLSKQPSKFFIPTCYEKIADIKPEISGIDLGNGEICAGRNTFKLNSPVEIDTIISNNVIIPHKLYRNSGNNIDYNTNLATEIGGLKDNNSKTFKELDTTIYKEINIELVEIIKSGSFEFNYINSSKNYRSEFKISTDGEKYFPVLKKDIENYDFKYLKINFKSNLKNEANEKIKIIELSFKSKNYEYLVKTLGDFTIYSGNFCEGNDFYYFGHDVGDFNLEKDTTTLNTNFKNNPNFDPEDNKDKDNDGTLDFEDNCPEIYNINQKDKNGNGIGDACSDVDKDGYVGYKDNCPYVYNPKQKDININDVGDLCEFDKDEDGIFDHLDNCINTYNPDQGDYDYDGIGVECDNCSFYNPLQIDKNNNGVGDVCADREKYLKNNDSDKDGILDNEDNCENISNPNQEDIDSDGIGDICDNCSKVQNNNQLDFNENGVGDICEDSDNDGVEGITDNCINISNSDQKDSDNNGIGNVCEDKDGDKILFLNDNCPHDYNPDQSDIDGDMTGDKCDTDDGRFIESNKEIFILLLVLLAAIFGFAIFKMVKKLK